MRKGFRFRRRVPAYLAAALMIASFAILSLRATNFANGKIPAPYFAVPDSGGANNGPGQKDLTQMGWFEDVSNASDPVIDLFWSWDEISINGGNTLDGCALFDNNGNTLIDYAICGTVNGKTNTMYLKTVTAYTCVDTRNDRCGGPAVKPANPGDIVGGGLKGTPMSNLPATTDELTTNTDPFSAGAGYPNDTTLRLRIRRSFLPLTAKLTNVCSYPSTQPNSDPSDCNNPPGSGFLRISKNVGQSGQTSKLFPFSVTSIPSTIEGENNCPVGTPCQETASQNESATLSLLVGSASITEGTTTGWSLVASYCGAPSTSNNNPLSVTIESGVIAECTFENGLDVGTITLTKIVNDGGTFKLSITGGATTVEDIKANGGSISAVNVPTGAYVLQEFSAGGLLSNYTSSYSCTATAQNGQVSTFGDQGTSTGTLTLDRNETIACTFTNTRIGATLKITKSLNNNAYPAGHPDAKQLSNFTYQVLDTNNAIAASGNFGAGTVTHNLDPNLSPYNVVEASAAGYSTTYSNCTALMVESGLEYNCLVTNTALKKAPTGTTIMTWVIHDSFDLANFRGDPSVGSPKVLFSLFQGTNCSGAAYYSESVNISALGKASTVSGKLVPAGTYSWVAKYDGNAYNEPFTTACGSEVTTITGN